MAHALCLYLQFLTYLRPGEVVSEEDLDWLRPPCGLPPGEEGLLIGRRMVATVVAGEPLLAEHVK